MTQSNIRKLDMSQASQESHKDLKQDIEEIITAVVKRGSLNGRWGKPTDKGYVLFATQSLLALFEEAIREARIDEVSRVPDHSGMDGDMVTTYKSQRTYKLQHLKTRRSKT